MAACFQTDLDTAKEDVESGEEELSNLLAGSNIAGFSKVAAAMHVRGTGGRCNMF